MAATAVVCFTACLWCHRFFCITSRQSIVPSLHHQQTIHSPIIASPADNP
jgi:hypothetical protein